MGNKEKFIQKVRILKLSPTELAEFAKKVNENKSFADFGFAFPEDDSVLKEYVTGIIGTISFSNFAIASPITKGVFTRLYRFFSSISVLSCVKLS
jgi:hypothetical protein